MNIHFHITHYASLLRKVSDVRIIFVLFYDEYLWTTTPGSVLRHTRNLPSTTGPSFRFNECGFLHKDPFDRLVLHL